MESVSQYQTLRYDPIVKKLQETLQTAEQEGASENLKNQLQQILNLRYMRDKYGLDMSTPPSEALKQIYSTTVKTEWKMLNENKQTKEVLPSVMITGHWEGQLLKMLVSMQGAKRVLEIGMYTGYAALSMAEALPPDGELITCDIEPYLEKVAQENFKKSRHGDKIKIKIGPAQDILDDIAKQGKQFDFCFIDADKSSYITYFKKILDLNLLASHGSIAFDNTYWSGKCYIVDEKEYEVIKEFNKFLADDPRIFQVLVPIRDGLTLVRKKDDVEYTK